MNKKIKEKIEDWEVRFCDIWGDCKFSIRKIKKSCDFIRQEKQKLIEELKKIKKWLEPQPGAGKGIGPLAGVGMYMQYKWDRQKHEEQIEELIKKIENDEVKKV